MINVISDSYVKLMVYVRFSLRGSESSQLPIAPGFMEHQGYQN